MRRVARRAPVLITLAACVALAACSNPPAENYRMLPPIDAAPPPDAEPPPPPVAAPPLAQVTGASKEAGARLFAERCVSCHGKDGRGKTDEAKLLRRAPTNLTQTGYICRSTDARPFSVPSDTDVEGALDRGSHRGRKDIASLDAAARRSLTLHVKTLTLDFANPPSPLAIIAPKAPDDAASRARGRTLFLTLGCWRCHGLDGAGAEPAALAHIRWNDQPIAKLTPLAQQEAYTCGDTPDAVYRTISLGISAGGATIMPRYQELLEDFARPWKVAPADWTKSLDGKVAPAEADEVRTWLTALPEREAMQKLKPSEKRARAGAMIWDVVHYVRSL